MCSSATAKPESILIEKSGSPDGHKEIIIVPPDDDIGISSGTAKIRDVKTGKILGSFDWSGFGEHASSTSFQVLWSRDSRCFAINWELTRGFVTCAVYAQTSHGWHQIKLPDLGKLSSKKAKVAGENHVYVDENWGGKGHETALAWLPCHRLRIETGYRGITNQQEHRDWEQLYWFTFQIVGVRHTPHPRAELKSVEPASDAAYRNDRGASHVLFISQTIRNPFFRKIL